MKRFGTLQDDPQPETTATIDLSPLLDMVFLLLIFFMTTTVFVRETGLELERPQASTAPSLEPTSPPPAPPPAAQEQPQTGEQTAQQENPAEAPAASESSAIPNTPEPQDAAPSAAAPETAAPQEPNQSGDPAAADRPEQPAAAPEPQAPTAGTEVRVQSFFNGGERTPQAAARLSRELPAGTPAEQDAVYRLYYFAGENGESSVLMDYAACLDPGKPQWGSIDKDAPAAWELYEKAKGTQPQAASAQQALRTWLEQKAAAGDARAARWLRDINQESHP